MKRKSYQKSGYLEEEERVFYLTDQILKEIPFHYHDFYKIIILLSGNISYLVEGRQYELEPFDILLISAGEIHRPVDHGGKPYSRIILYLSESFFMKNSTSDTDLFFCFQKMKEAHSNLLRLHNPGFNIFLQSIEKFKHLSAEKEYGTDLYQKTCILEFLILVNRVLYQKENAYTPSTVGNPLVQDVLRYIHEHLAEDLSIEKISGHFYLNRSYLMHLFKSETGYTIGKYITEKRLYLTDTFRKKGIPVTQACILSGFKNYSAYYHARAQKKAGEAAPFLPE